MPKADSTASTNSSRAIESKSVSEEGAAARQLPRLAHTCAAISCRRSLGIGLRQGGGRGRRSAPLGFNGRRRPADPHEVVAVAREQLVVHGRRGNAEPTQEGARGGAVEARTGRLKKSVGHGLGEPCVGLQEQRGERTEGILRLAGKTPQLLFPFGKGRSSRS